MVALPRAAAALVLALLVAVATARVPDCLHRRVGAGAADACDTCKFAVHVLDDLLCDPFVDDSLVTWVEANVCSHMSDKQQCSDLVRGLAPALVEWLRANASPEAMCADARVCGAPRSYGEGWLQQPKRQHVRASRPNDMTCPLCMFVATKIKEQISDPATQADIQAASLAACAQLPQGIMRDACTDFVQQYEMTLVRYVADLEAEEVCMMIGTCLDTAVARLQAAHAAPLLQLAPAVLEPLGRLRSAIEAAPTPANDHCETCKAVVQELHQLAANPELQGQLVDYAKEACTVFPSFTDTCVADVDQYAPVVFGMILAYLQPEQVCVQLKMCPPPSLFAALSAQAGLLRGKYAGAAAGHVWGAWHGGAPKFSSQGAALREPHASGLELPQAS